MKKTVFFLAGFFVILILGCKIGGAVSMRITSPAFTHNSSIPREFTCQGDDVNPPLVIEGVPAGTKSLALIMDDPDAPMGTWVHWVVYNIPADTTIIEKNSVPGVQLVNSFGRESYGGPCPPSGTHRYFFKVYALDITLKLDKNSKKKDLEKAMEGHILAKAELMGLYKKQ